MQGPARLLTRVGDRRFRVNGGYLETVYAFGGSVYVSWYPDGKQKFGPGSWFRLARIDPVSGRTLSSVRVRGEIDAMKSIDGVLWWSVTSDNGGRLLTTTLRRSDSRTLRQLSSWRSTGSEVDIASLAYTGRWTWLLADDGAFVRFDSATGARDGRERIPTSAQSDQERAIAGSPANGGVLLMTGVTDPAGPRYGAWLQRRDRATGAVQQRRNFPGDIILKSAGSFEDHAWFEAVGQRLSTIDRLDLQTMSVHVVDPGLRLSDDGTSQVAGSILWLQADSSGGRLLCADPRTGAIHSTIQLGRRRVFQTSDRGDIYLTESLRHTSTLVREPVPSACRR